MVTNPLKNSNNPFSSNPNLLFEFNPRYEIYAIAIGTKRSVSIKSPSKVGMLTFLRISPYNAKDNGNIRDIKGKLPSA